MMTHAATSMEFLVCGTCRAFGGTASGEQLLQDLTNHEQSGVPADAGTDSAAGFDLVRHLDTSSTMYHMTGLKATHRVESYSVSIAVDRHARVHLVHAGAHACAARCTRLTAGRAASGACRRHERERFRGGNVAVYPARSRLQSWHIHQVCKFRPAPYPYVVGMHKHRICHTHWRLCDEETAVRRSPHLMSLRERISVNGESISGKGFDALVSGGLTAARAAMGEQFSGISHFEMMTALALQHFKQQQVRRRSDDLWVVEDLESLISGNAQWHHIRLHMLCVTMPEGTGD